LSVAKA